MAECSEVSSGYGGLEAALPKGVLDKFLKWLKEHLLSYIQKYFGKITKDVISSPGFNDRVNVFCCLVLKLAVKVVPGLGIAILVPKVKQKVLNFIKVQVKNSLVVILVASGEQYEAAKAFVNKYVSDTVPAKVLEKEASFTVKNEESLTLTLEESLTLGMVC